MLSRNLLITVAGGVLLLVTGFYIGRGLHESQSPQNTEKHQGGYKYISPLLECNNFKPSDLGYNKMRHNLQEIIDLATTDKKIKTASVYFRDLNNGPWIGINEKEKFSPASLLKVPLMIIYLKLAENNPEILSEKLFIKEYDKSILSQNISPANQVKVGEEYTVEELINYMIRYSDNTAANTLSKNIPPTDMDSIYNDLKIQIPGIGETENFMTVVDYASFFRILYNSSYLNRIMSEKALKILTLSNFSQGLTAGLPINIEVAHKFGERKLGDEKQLHDCGIIYFQNNNYLLCVMTRGDDFKTIEETIGNISRQVFKDINEFTNR